LRLRRTKDLREYTIAATDADIGRVRDFYFDDETWTIRYVVVATGAILAGREVLISPAALRQRAWSPLHIRVNLTWKQVESSPTVDIHRPISRQCEIDQHDHYGWPYYWLGAGVWGVCTHPSALAEAPKARRSSQKQNPSADAHLRASEEVSHYHLSAVDGEIGHVEDFLFDDKTWEIRYVIIKTGKWWAGRRVLISPRWIKRVSWTKRMIDVNLSRDRIKKSPPWDPDQAVSRKYELQLHKHYGLPPYWTSLQSGTSVAARDSG
jgi:uncharacterized protein YrrD